ncbi:MAG: DbpA RNA binding domain-containing protein [Anaerolineae bacterium]|nr:DbpA RNA binding domain-containing protein [Gemmatimonadaceae bacterium]
MEIGKPREQRGGKQDDASPRQVDTVTVVRGQNSVFVLPSDPSSMAEFLPQALDRVNRAEDAIQLLVLTADAESAIALARGVNHSDERSLRTLPITGIPRAMRVLAAGKPHVVTGAPTTLLELIRTSALKLESVKSVLIAWADGIAPDETSALESIMAEVPKEAARTIVASRLTPAVDALVERYARRAGRAAEKPADNMGGVSITFVTVSPASRSSMLRRLLDHVNPDLASIYVRSDAARMEVEDLLRALGYGASDNSISVAHRSPPKPGAAVVLYEQPASRAELSAAIGPDQPAIFALVNPSQLPALRLLAGRGTVEALSLPGPTESAAKSEHALRGRLRQLLGEGAPAREVLALEPLLDEFDGIEIAAAVLKLLQRSGDPAPQPAPAPAPEIDVRASTLSMVRIFVSAGKGDGVSPGDLVGAITAESGISSVKIGKIEIRERHALVEISSDVAEAVVGAVAGIMIKGRRIIAKIDSGSPRDAERGSRDGGRHSKPRDSDARPRDRDIRTRDRQASPRDRETRSRDGGARQGDRTTRQGGPYVSNRAPRTRSSGPSTRERSDRQSSERSRPRE